MLILIEYDFFCNRYNGKLFVVINLWVGLVSLFKFFDFIGIIGISLFIFYFFGLCYLEVYFLRYGNSWICIFGR